MIKLAPSILAADPINLERDVRLAAQAGCDWIHVDGMDAHFVPNLAYGPAVVRRLGETFQLPLDVHLMMDHPDKMLRDFLQAGASSVTVHAETGDVSSMLQTIRDAGALAGVALKPGTPAKAAIRYFDSADLILVMTVEPGFGGQKLDEQVISKIRALRDLGYNGEIEADGGIREDNLQALINEGLTVAVMGTALFHNEDMKAAAERMHRMKPQKKAF